MDNISSRIHADYRFLDPDLVKKWLTIRELLEFKYVANTVSITPVTALKYKGDLFSLLSFELGVQPIYIYPHALANGYDGLTDYNGDKLSFKLLDVSKLKTYYDAFTRDPYP